MSIEIALLRTKNETLIRVGNVFYVDGTNDDGGSYRLELTPLQAAIFYRSFVSSHNEYIDEAFDADDFREGQLSPSSIFGNYYCNFDYDGENFKNAKEILSRVFDDPIPTNGSFTPDFRPDAILIEDSGHVWQKETYFLKEIRVSSVRLPTFLSKDEIDLEKFRTTPDKEIDYDALSAFLHRDDSAMGFFEKETLDATGFFTERDVRLKLEPSFLLHSDGEFEKRTTFPNEKTYYEDVKCDYWLFKLY